MVKHSTGKEPVILIVDDSPEVRAGLGAILAQEYSKVLVATSAFEALAVILDRHVDLVVSDISMPDMDGMELLTRIKEKSAGTAVIMITGYGSVASAVDAMKRGAYHYIAKPFRPAEILLQVERALQRLSLEREVEDLRRIVGDHKGFEGIIAESKKMLDIFEVIAKVAPTDAPVMVRGESGTGKELIARAIHSQSRRRDGQFLGINAAALPEQLLEAELFGYRKGAFTGAVGDKDGLLTSAKGGTVFLDEISRMPVSSQAKLLRAIEEMEVLPVGGLDPVKVDARIISATNSPGSQDIRQDLFYRLSVMEIKVPPLRERSGDVPLLATHFVEVYSGKFAAGPKRLTAEAIEVLSEYHWPGNVRELENAIQRAVVVSSKEEIGPADIGKLGVSGFDDVVMPGADIPYERAKREAVTSFQREYVKDLLGRTNGNISKAADKAGITRGALYAIMEKTGFRRKAKGDQRL